MATHKVTKRSFIVILGKAFEQLSVGLQATSGVLDEPTNFTKDVARCGSHGFVLHQLFPIHNCPPGAAKSARIWKNRMQTKRSRRLPPPFSYLTHKLSNLKPISGAICPE